MAEILIVDDEELDREMAGRSLGSLPGVELRFSKDGNEALAAVAESEPQLVLTDLDMPGLNGLELVRKLQQTHPGLPVVVMTSSGNEAQAVAALQSGATSFVPKKVLIQDLNDAVQKGLAVAEVIRHRNLALGRLKRSETDFELENDTGLVSAVACYFQDHLRSLNFADELVRSRIGIALMEAVSNAMIHGNLEIGSSLRRKDRDRFDNLIEERRTRSPYKERRVRCRASETSERVTYVIEDEGKGFDPTNLPDPRDLENLLNATGRGVMLMQTFMDRVEFNRKGNRVTLVKNLSEPGRR